MNIDYRTRTNDVDWASLKASLAADNFDNGRSTGQLRRSFDNSHAVVIAWLDGEVIGTARVLSDGGCNAYLVGAAIMELAANGPRMIDIR